MAAFIDIKRVEIDPKNLRAHVRIADGAPLMTSDDIEGTARVYHLVPQIIEHECSGDAGTTFRDAMGDTELAHLLEHVVVELLAQTDRAGDVATGRTLVDEVDDRTYVIELACPDDVLVCAALACAVWVLQWAYTDGSEPEPDIAAIVSGLVNLTEEAGDPSCDLVVEPDLPDVDEILAAIPESTSDEAADAQEEPSVEDAEEGDVFDRQLREQAQAARARDRKEDGAEYDELWGAGEAQGMPGYDPESESDAEEESESKPVPLWTPAPEIPASAEYSPHLYDEDPVAPELEAELDQIMAALEHREQE
jgi:hypothetical protein